MTLLLAAHPLVHVNASLNALATVLLVLGLIFIKRGRVDAHKRTMLAAFGVSVIFLCCYVWYHWSAKHVEFTHPGVIRYVYYVILASHVLLAITVPFLAIRQMYLGYRAVGCCSGGMTEPEKMATSALYREKHMRLAKWVFPIWLYVSVTGVVVYVMLYQLWPQPANDLELTLWWPRFERGRRCEMKAIYHFEPVVVRWVIAALVVALVLMLASVAAACPTCKDGLAQNDPQGKAIAAGYAYSILFMMSMPYLVLGTVGSLAYLSIRRARLANAAAHSESEAAAVSTLT